MPASHEIHRTLYVQNTADQLQSSVHVCFISQFVSPDDLYEELGTCILRFIGFPHSKLNVFNCRMPNLYYLEATAKHSVYEAVLQFNKQNSLLYDSYKRPPLIG